MTANEQTITVAATKLYAALKHLSLDWGKRHVRLPDLTAASMALIDVSELADAKQELERVGLLTIMHLGRTNTAKYIFSTEAEQQTRLTLPTN